MKSINLYKQIRKNKTLVAVVTLWLILNYWQQVMCLYPGMAQITFFHNPAELHDTKLPVYRLQDYCLTKSLLEKTFCELVLKEKIISLPKTLKLFSDPFKAVFILFLINLTGILRPLNSFNYLKPANRRQNSLFSQKTSLLIYD